MFSLFSKLFGLLKPWFAYSYAKIYTIFLIWFSISQIAFIANGKHHNTENKVKLWRDLILIWHTLWDLQLILNC